MDIDREVTLEDWQEFASKSCEAMKSLQSFVVSERCKGKRFCVYGASAKSTVMLNACHLDSSNISFICDGTSFKQWKKSPGTNIPIVDEGALLREMPDYAICCAWNFFEEIKAKNSLYIQKGGKLIHPLNVQI